MARRTEATDRADLHIWLSITDPTRVQQVIGRYITSLEPEREQEILRASRTWPRYFRDTLDLSRDRGDATEIRAGLISVFSTSFRAVQLLPKKERRRFLELCRLSESEDMASLIAPEESERVPHPIPVSRLALAAAMLVLGVGFAAFFAHGFTRVPAVHESVSRAAPATAPPHRVAARRVTVHRIAARHVAVRRVARIRHVTPVHHVTAAPIARTFTPPMRPLVQPKAIVANLYNETTPNAALQSTLIADELTLVPRGDNFQLGATQPLSTASQRARLCFVGGTWRSC